MLYATIFEWLLSVGYSDVIINYFYNLKFCKKWKKKKNEIKMIEAVIF